MFRIAFWGGANMRTSFAAVALAALVLVSVPTAAVAATDTATARPGGGAVAAEVTDDGYTPTAPEEPTLTGSSALGECEDDVPWIDYSIVLSDPDGQVTNRTVRMIITDGNQSTTLVLGELQGNQLSGRVLWPGASVDENGNAAGWPGWAFVDGTWVETDGNFAWTRGDISAVIEVNPELSVPLAYPPIGPYCANGPEAASAGLAATGGTLTALVPAAIAGGMVILGGAGILLLRRRRS